MFYHSGPFYLNSIISQDENTEAKEAGSEDLKENNTIFKKELEDEKKKCLSLERECEVYQSQVEVSECTFLFLVIFFFITKIFASVFYFYIYIPKDYQHRLETERSDRHVSESRALQMLQDMKEKAKMSQQLREEQMRLVKKQLPEQDCIVETLQVQVFFICCCPGCCLLILFCH